MLGVRSDATDGWDAELDYLIGTAGTGFAGVYHEYDPEGWLGDTGFYRTDYRSLLAPDEGMSWESLYVWADPSYPEEEESMYFSMVSDSTYPPPPDRRYLLHLVSVPDGVSGAPDEGTVWELLLDEVLTLDLPTYRTTNGLDGYRFSFTITAVPEPTTIGLVAVGGALLLSRSRRRRST
ncbi:MAG: PEP-CTERM sorting domain-containing protein [Phycisphaerae bacterium]|nr:PEP-CTERM sorting domain-containing protein [Phycisphaerae bacterium]